MLKSFDCLFFYSKKGVEYFFVTKPELSKHIKIAALGTGTASAVLNTTGKTPDFKGDGNPESTAASLKNVAVGQKVLFVRARESKKSIQQLLANKLTVLELIVYKNVPKNDIQKSDADILFFTSAMYAEAYLKKYMAEKHQDAYSIEIKTPSSKALPSQVLCSSQDLPVK